MSFLTALLGGAGGYLGGYGAGKQQALQNRQEQQRLNQEQAYREAEERRQDEELRLEQQKQQLAVDAYQRNLGKDPATGKPFVVPLPLSQVAPNNKGKQPTDQQTLAHLYALANWYNQTGQSDMAASTMDRAKAMESDIRANNALMLRQTLDLYNQGQMDQRSANAIAGALQRNQNTIGGASSREQTMADALMARALLQADTSTQNNIRTTGTSRQNTLDNIRQRNQTQTDLFMRGYEAQNARAAADAAKSGNPVVLPYPNLDAFKRNLSSNIATVAQDPKKLASLLKALDAHAKDYDPEWIRYATQALQEAAQSASQPIGGSQANQNPQYPGP